MTKFLLQHKKVITRALKLWGPVAAFFILVYIGQLLGIWALLIGFVVLVGGAIGLYTYLDFQESLQDESFRNIFRNLNRIDDMFKNNIDYKQIAYIHEDSVYENPYFVIDNNSVEERNLFSLEDNICNYQFYCIKDENRFGVVLCVERKNIDLPDNTFIYFTGKNYPADTLRLREMKLVKIGETIHFNIYAKKGTKITKTLYDKVDLLIPEGNKRKRLIGLSNDKIVYYTDNLAPFVLKDSDTMGDEEINTLICSEVQFFRNQLEKMEQLLDSYHVKNMDKKV